MNHSLHQDNVLLEAMCIVWKSNLIRSQETHFPQKRDEMCYYAIGVGPTGILNIF